MKMRVPKPGQLQQRDRLWDAMQAEHKKLNDALKKGNVTADAFKKLWESFVKARKAYEDLGAAIPEVEVPSGK
jgi:hypothetical protein